MQELIYGPFLSLKQARAQGLKRYYTGKPCKNGHVAVRFVQGSQCVTCKALWASKSQKRNKTAKNARQKRYREKHRDELRQSGRDRYASFSPERKAKYTRERSDYHSRNPEVARRCYRKTLTCLMYMLWLTEPGSGKYLSIDTRGSRNDESNLCSNKAPKY